MAEKKQPKWMNVKQEELEKIVIDLAKKGESTGRIGLILRDNYGVPKAKLFGKSISKIIKDAKIELKSEKSIVSSKINILKTHLEKNKHDHTATRSLTKRLWVLRKISK